MDKFLKNVNKKIHFKFQKWKNSKIKKMKNFNFFISNFRDIFQNFQISIQISKSIFFQFFPFPMAIFFKIQKQKFQFKFQKMIFFQNFSFQIFSMT
jgi:hypothetical protein